MSGDQGLYKWLREGYEKGYCSDLYCENHDGVHRDDMETYEKLLEEYEGNDFCWTIVKLYTGWDESSPNPERLKE